MECKFKMSNGSSTLRVSMCIVMQCPVCMDLCGKCSYSYLQWLVHREIEGGGVLKLDC